MTSRGIEIQSLEWNRKCHTEMKRELKFRAWDKNRNEMVSSFLLAPTSPSWGPFVNRTDEAVDKLVNTHYLKQGDILGGHYTMLDWSDWYGLDNYEVMQFTGLKDKNGVEIYEGDLLQFVGCFFEVCFDRGAFYGDPLAANDIRGHLSCQSFPDALVIGNIYSNPELLKQ